MRRTAIGLSFALRAVTELGQKRGIVDHCDKACLFHNRQLCPPYKRDKLIEDCEQEKQHQNMDCVDEDTDSDNHMQLENAPNYYYLHCMETHHEEENDCTTLMDAHPPDDKGEVHCIE